MACVGNPCPRAIIRLASCGNNRKHWFLNQDRRERHVVHNLSRLRLEYFIVTHPLNWSLPGLCYLYGKTKKLVKTGNGADGRSRTGTPFGHCPLKTACLPIPPHRHGLEILFVIRGLTGFPIQAHPRVYWQDRSEVLQPAAQAPSAQLCSIPSPPCCAPWPSRPAPGC